MMAGNRAEKRAEWNKQEILLLVISLTLLFIAGRIFIQGEASQEISAPAVKSNGNGTQALGNASGGIGAAAESPGNDSVPDEKTNVDNESKADSSSELVRKYYRCGISASPSTLLPGESTIAYFSTYSADKYAVFSYTCANETIGIGNGMQTGYKLCKYDAEGNYTLRVFVDGVQCASSTVTVKKQTAVQKCTINNESMRKDGLRYFASVSFEGFESNDSVTWNCGNLQNSQQIGIDSNYAVSKKAYVRCEFEGPANVQNINVSVGNVKCGSIQTE